MTSSRIETARQSFRRMASERGQVLLMFVGFFSLITVAGVIALDVSYWYSERRGIARATDLAALAAVQELPQDRARAETMAYDFARRNGYEDGVDGIELEMRFFCGNSLPNPPPGICHNELAPLLSICEPGEVGCDALEVKIRRPARSYFGRFFGIDHVTTSYASLANVKFNLVPIDTALAVDATSSMGINSSLCNGSQTNNGCPIKEARDAANRFVDIVLDGTSTLTGVGYVPYRGCFDPPKTSNPNAFCIRDAAVSGVANVTDLTTDPNLLHTEINQTHANVAGSGTNVCWPLRRARTMLAASTQTGAIEQFVVILTDGNNVYNSEVFQASPSPGSPPISPDSCRPSNATSNDADLSASCNTTQQREGSLDERTWDVAQALESDGVEIYVIGFGVCGGDQPCSGPDADLSQCPPVSEDTCNMRIGDTGGGSNHDNTADRRLLKCLASSSPDTNDHYFEVELADDLPAIFQVVAFEIASRGLTEGQ
jgi:hypothetical protein